MSKKIYLIEDEEPFFSSVKDKLSSEFTIVPTEANSPYTELKNYLNDPNESNKQKVIDYILQAEVEIIILDIKLFGEEHAGIYLYDRIFSQDERLSKLLVIYLTGTHLQAELTLNKNTDYVQKRSNSRGFDADETVKVIKQKISQLLKIDDDDSQWYFNNV